jgi:hypothetical protein
MICRYTRDARGKREAFGSLIPIHHDKADGEYGEERRRRKAALACDVTLKVPAAIVHALHFNREGMPSGRSEVAIDLCIPRTRAAAVEWRHCDCRQRDQGRGGREITPAAKRIAPTRRYSCSSHPMVAGAMSRTPTTPTTIDNPRAVPQTRNHAKSAAIAKGAQIRR